MENRNFRVKKPDRRCPNQTVKPASCASWHNALKKTQYHFCSIFAKMFNLGFIIKTQ